MKDVKAYKTSKNPEIQNQLNKNLGSLYSLIDKATKKNIFHKNTAARKKSRLALSLKLVSIQ